MSHDIVDAIATFRVAFLRENMKPPTTILLADHDEGMRLISYMRDSANWSYQIGDIGLGKPIEMADGSVYMEMNICGMAVRWPANRYALPDGSWAFS